MFHIRQERKSETGDFVSIWLKATAPTAKWGPRESAIEFLTKGDARRGALAGKISGAWYIEAA
jgi:hypothetical protein